MINKRIIEKRMVSVVAQLHANEKCYELCTAPRQFTVFKKVQIIAHCCVPFQQNASYRFEDNRQDYYYYAFSAASELCCSGLYSWNISEPVNVLPSNTYLGVIVWTSCIRYRDQNNLAVIESIDSVLLIEISSRLLRTIASLNGSIAFTAIQIQYFGACQQILMAKGLKLWWAMQLKYKRLKDLQYIHSNT